MSFATLATRPAFPPPRALVAPVGTSLARRLPSLMPDVETQTNDELRIKLVSNHGKETLFIVKPSTKLGRVMRAYCTRLNLRMDATRFIFDGNRLNEGLRVSGGAVPVTLAFGWQPRQWSAVLQRLEDDVRDLRTAAPGKDVIWDAAQ